MKNTYIQNTEAKKKYGNRAKIEETKHKKRKHMNKQYNKRLFFVTQQYDNNKIWFECSRNGLHFFCNWYYLEYFHMRDVGRSMALCPKRIVHHSRVFIYVYSIIHTFYTSSTILFSAMFYLFRKRVRERERVCVYALFSFGFSVFADVLHFSIDEHVAR